MLPWKPESTGGNPKQSLGFHHEGGPGRTKCYILLTLVSDGALVLTDAMVWTNL